MTREERELSIEYLEKIKEDYIEGNAYERHPLPEYYAIENAIKALEQEPRWIPVTERLPDEGYSVLVMRITDENYKYMRVATYQGDCWMDDTDKFNKPNPHKVIAWMPLPQPYKGGQEDGKA